MPEADIKFVEAYRAGHAVQAHAIKFALEEAGIPVMIENESLQDAIGDFPCGWSSAPRLMVPDSQLKLAREIIRQTDHSEERAVGMTLDESVVGIAAGLMGWVGIGLVAAANSPTEADDQDYQPETTRCLTCQAIMGESDETCSQCGWTYSESEELEPYDDETNE